MASKIRKFHSPSALNLSVSLYSTSASLLHTLCCSAENEFRLTTIVTSSAFDIHFTPFLFPQSHRYTRLRGSWRIALTSCAVRESLLGETTVRFRPGTLNFRYVPFSPATVAACLRRYCVRGERRIQRYKSSAQSVPQNPFHPQFNPPMTTTSQLHFQCGRCARCIAGLLRDTIFRLPAERGSELRLCHLFASHLVSFIKPLGGIESFQWVNFHEQTRPQVSLSLTHPHI
ncbi:hypothetical protein C8R43DRAFT_1039942 [Mycena crocata]|nr:hypothetical protein C8R43DRAFT_1039942 [Mycena crocata]